MSETTVEATKAMHTAGPWRTRGTGIEARAFDGTWRWITPVVHGGTPTQATANADLMTAAPDLLQAARQAVEVWRLDQIRASERGTVALEALLVAIDKAEGQS